MIDQKEYYALHILAQTAAAGGWVRVPAATSCYIRPGRDGAATAQVVHTSLGWVGESFACHRPLVLELPSADGWWGAVRALQDAERASEGWVAGGPPMHFGPAPDAPGWSDLPAGPQDVMPLRRLGRVVNEEYLVILELNSASRGRCWMATVNSRAVTNGMGVPLVFFTLLGATQAAEQAVFGDNQEAF